jgi:hypothetical protein
LTYRAYHVESQKKLPPPKIETKDIEVIIEQKESANSKSLSIKSSLFSMTDLPDGDIIEAQNSSSSEKWNLFNKSSYKDSLAALK